MTDPLALEPEGDGWRLLLVRRLVAGGAAAHRSAAERFARDAARQSGLRLDAGAGARASARPGRCCGDWPRRRRPLAVSHVGNPPHFLDLLQKLHVESACRVQQRSAAPTLERLVGKLGRWSVLQGGACARRDRVSRAHRDGDRRGVLAAASMANLFGGAAYLRNRHYRDSDRRADRISDQRDRGVSRRAAAVALRRRYFRGRSGDHRDFCARWACC